MENLDIERQELASLCNELLDCDGDSNLDNRLRFLLKYVQSRSLNHRFDKVYVWDRSLCCAKDFNPKDPQRMFSDIVEKETSDCCFSWPDANVYCNNPVCGLICPIAAFAHIVMCSLASCFCTEAKFKEWTQGFLYLMRGVYTGIGRASIVTIP